MGITGLLTTLKPIEKCTNLKALKGQTVGIDIYVWLHRGAVSCSLELLQGKECSG